MFKKKDVIYTIYRKGGFSKAAEELHISQPSLSVMVSKVEADLGEKLFDRSSNPIKLTAVGHKYIECCESINMIEDDFQSFLSEYTGLGTGDFTLGGSNLFITNLMPHILSIYSMRHPGIHFKLVEHGSLELKKMLVAGDIDIVIENELYDDSQFDSYPIGNEYLLIAVPHNDEVNAELAANAYTAQEINSNCHVRATKPFLDNLKPFTAKPFIQMQRGYDTRNRSDHVFGEAGIELRSLFDLDQLSSTFSMAASGLGLAVVSDTIVKNSPGWAEKLLYYAVEHEAFRRKVCYYTRHDKLMTPALNELISISRELKPLTLSV